MEPAPEDVIEAIAYTFEHDIMPELSSPWAKRMASTTLWALDHLKRRFLYEHAFAVEENGELKRLIAGMRTRLQDGDLRQVLQGGLAEDLPLEERQWPSLRELTEENHRLREAVERVIIDFPELEGNDGARELWGEIVGYIQAQTDREFKLSG